LKLSRWTLAASLSVLVACGDPFVPRIGVATLDDGGSDDFVEVTAGREHSCALTADGTAYCWGSNEFGQLGIAQGADTCARDDRNISCETVPRAVSGTLKFQRIRAGGAHTCAIGIDQRMYCWGDNLHGQLGDPSLRNSFSPVPAVTTALFTDLALGGSHSCGLRSDAVLLCWGANDIGQIGVANVGNGVTVPTATQTTQRFASVAAGARRTCARTADGTTFCWGTMWVARSAQGVETVRPQAQPFRIQQAPAFQLLAVGTNSTCGIALDNSAHCWEANPTGSIGNGTTDGNIAPQPVAGDLRFVGIAAGEAQTCGIVDTGLAYCWGADAHGQLGKSPAAISERCTAGAVACSRLPIPVSGWRRFAQLAAGQQHVCGLTIGGNVYCWGAGAMGQRGDGRRTFGEWSPVKTASP
jgi:alpha-tubulin suppressor-like RCC1 family protein